MGNLQDIEAKERGNLFPRRIAVQPIDHAFNNKNNAESAMMRHQIQNTSSKVSSPNMVKNYIFESNSSTAVPQSKRYSYKKQITNSVLGCEFQSSGLERDPSAALSTWNKIIKDNAGKILNKVSSASHFASMDDLSQWHSGHSPSFSKDCKFRNRLHHGYSNECFEMESPLTIDNLATTPTNTKMENKKFKQDDSSFEYSHASDSVKSSKMKIVLHLNPIKSMQAISTTIKKMKSKAKISPLRTPTPHKDVQYTCSIHRAGTSKTTLQGRQVQKSRNAKRRLFGMSSDKENSKIASQNNIQKILSISRSRRRSSLKSQVYDQLVLYQAFNILSNGKNTIGIEDLMTFIDSSTLSPSRYEDIREIVHGAVNKYELDYDDFERIMKNDILSEKNHSSIQDCLHDTQSIFSGCSPKVDSTGMYEKLSPEALLVLNCNHFEDIDIEEYYKHLVQTFNYIRSKSCDYITAADIIRVMNQIHIDMSPNEIQNLIGKSIQDQIYFTEFLDLISQCNDSHAYITT